MLFSEAVSAVGAAGNDSFYEIGWNECQDALVEVNTNYYNDMQAMKDREGELIVARADLANCLGQNVGFRTEIDRLQNVIAGKNRIGEKDSGQKLEDCYYGCNDRFATGSGCADQCDRYRHDCLETCRGRFL